MNKFFNSWRNFLINENISNTHKLPKEVGILINTDNSPHEITIEFVDLLTGSPSNEPRGEVRIGNQPSENEEWYGACLGAWVVSFSAVDEEWAYLLFDVAIEWASMRGAGVGLAPNRASTDEASFQAWQKFLDGNKEIEVNQLDNLENDLTPDERDNCSQGAAITAASKQGTAWHQTPISKIYKKKFPTTIKKLQKLKKLVFKEEQALSESIVSPVYHGSTVDFDKFDFNKSKEFGFHFGTKASAEHRGNNNFIKKYSVEFSNLLTLDDVMRWDLKNILSNMNLRGYIKGSEKDKLLDALSRKAIQNSKNNGTSLRQEKNNALRDFLISIGYDGIKYENRGETGGTAYIAFSPSQIKEIK